MNSWDCFDTLIARRYQYHYTIFDEVGNRLSIPNFREMRISAEKKSDGTYASIYKNLPGINPNIEIEIDTDHCFPIIENIQKVNDGDCIISDIYYPTDVVKKILRKCGLTKNVKFFVSPDGKRNGWIWDKVGKIDLHIGDNKKTDVKSPRNYGIRSLHYTNSFFNSIEEKVSTTNLNLSLWMRCVRLQCPYTDDYSRQIYQDQTNYNLPLLALASLELPDKTIAFTFRDSVFWKPIYEKITGKSSIRFDSSRAILNNPTPEFKKYTEESLKNCVIADLQGTGRSLLNFFQNLPEVYFIGGKIKDHSNLNSISGLRAPALEKHNCSPEGSIIRWGVGGAIRAPVEHNQIIVEIQHKAFEIGLRYLDYYKINKDINNLKYLLESMKDDFTDKEVKWTENHNMSNEEILQPVIGDQSNEES
jgi:hypothetical protein